MSARLLQALARRVHTDHTTRLIYAITYPSRLLTSRRAHPDLSKPIMSSDSASMSQTTLSHHETPQAHLSIAIGSLTRLDGSEQPPLSDELYGKFGPDILWSLTGNQLSDQGVERMKRFVPLLREKNLKETITEISLAHAWTTNGLARSRLGALVMSARSRRSRRLRRSEEEDLTRLTEVLGALCVLKEHLYPAGEPTSSSCQPEAEVSTSSRTARLTKLPHTALAADESEWQCMRRMELLGPIILGILAGSSTESRSEAEKQLEIKHTQMTDLVDSYKTKMGFGATRGDGTTMNVPDELRSSDRDAANSDSGDRETWSNLIGSTYDLLRGFSEAKYFDVNETRFHDTAARARWWDEHVRSGRVMVCDDLPQYGVDGEELSPPCA